MSSPSLLKPSSRGSPTRSEIIIAVIGLAGVLSTGLLSNWDKLFPPKNIVTSTFSGYQPTGDPQIEIQYFMGLTGGGDDLKQKQELMQEYTRRAAESLNTRLDESEKLQKVMREEVEIMHNESNKVYVTIAAQYYSIAEIQELNRFYSTPTMREWVRKRSLMNRDLNMAMVEILERFRERLTKRLMEIDEVKRK